MPEGNVVALPTGSVRPDPEQHRKVFPEEYIAGLAESIRSQGQIMPIRVRKDPKGLAEYVVLDGECRHRACVYGGIPTILAIVCDGLSEFEASNVQAAANLARRDVEPSAAGRAIRRSIDALRIEKPWLSEEEAQAETQQALGVGTRFANSRLALIRLPEEVYTLVDQGSLKQEAALKLLPLVERHETAEAIRQALAAVARGYSVAQVAEIVKLHLNEGAQGSLFGGADVGRESSESRATKTVLARLVAIYERAQAVAFDDRKQEFRLGDLRAEDLAMIEAKLAGAANVLHRILAEVQAAQGKTPDIQSVTETVVSRPVETQQGTPAAEVAQEGAGPVPTPQNGPEAAVKQAVLAEPERIEFGSEVRVAMVGTWLWVSGVPERGSLAYALQKAGARWARGRQAWYSPRPEEQARIQAVLREYLSEPVTETAALEAAG